MSQKKNPGNHKQVSSTPTTNATMGVFIKQQQLPALKKYKWVSPRAATRPLLLSLSFLTQICC